MVYISVRKARVEKTRKILLGIFGGLLLFSIFYLNLKFGWKPQGSNSGKTDEVLKQSKVRAEIKNLSIPEIVSMVADSVVTIETFDRSDKVIGIGTGFFINDSGLIVTNRHVLLKAWKSLVKTKRGQYEVKEIVAEDVENDLVLLKINIRKEFATPLRLSKNLPNIGEKVIVIGNPLGLETTVSDGIVSAIRKIPEFGSVIQITCPLSAGSSGSPVINMRGEVVGIATFKILEGENLNFAIPIEKIKNLKPREGKEVKSYAEIPQILEKPFDKGLFLFMNKEYEDAIPYFKKVVSENLLNAEAHYYLGVCYRHTRNMRAIDELKAAIDINPRYAEAFYELGLTYNDFKFFKKAVEAFDSALRLKPDYREAKLNMAISYTELGEHENAIKILETLSKTSFEAETFYYLGYNYNKVGDHRKALNAYKEAIRLSPEYTEAYIGLGASYMVLQMWERAIEALNRATQIDPKIADAHFLLGLAYLAKEDISSAEEEYKILKDLKNYELADKLYSQIQYLKYRF
jgi:tetratricopeptide (TPR) repeat protein